MQQQQLNCQSIKALIRSYLSLNQAKEKDMKMQNEYLGSQKQVKTLSQETLETHIKLFQCQLIQKYSIIDLNENIFCGYNRNRKAQFLCSRKNCNKHAIICGQQTCKCYSDHGRCNFIASEPFLDRIRSHLQQPIPKQILLYFQTKLVIYEYMVNRISQERQALKDWQQDIEIGSEKSLFLYGLNQEKVAVHCNAPKVLYQQNISQKHDECGCIPLKMKSKNIQDDQRETIQAICKKIHKKYSSIINYFDQKIDKLYDHKKCANLNPAQFFFVEFLKNKEYFAIEDFQLKNSLNRCLKESSAAPGNTIYLAIKQRKKRLKSIDFKKFNINRVKKIWKFYSEIFFRLFIEGKTINELFYGIKNSQYLQAQQLQESKSYINKIIQSLSQGQKELFSERIIKKTKCFINLKTEQLKYQLKKQKGNNYNQLYILNSIIKTAVNDIKTVKYLGNLNNVTKLVIKWCAQMTEEVSIQVLNAMPNLKRIALLGQLFFIYREPSRKFMKKLCQLKQLKSFNNNFYSHSEYYRFRSEDYQFIGWFLVYQPSHQINDSIEELLLFSKLPHLQSIQINQVRNINNAQLIKNIKKLKHITLGYDQESNNKINFDLMEEIFLLRELRTLSLVKLQIKSNQVTRIIGCNPFLNTIIIIDTSNNDQIDDETVKCMNNLVQLQTLCISYNTEITGKYLSQLDSLIMLELKQCKRISNKEIKEALRNMRKLKHLSVQHNDWLDDEVLMSIRSCKELEYLNIEDAEVSGKGLKHLEDLNRLSVLICGRNKINGDDLIKLTRHVPSITRLSIWDLRVNENQLMKICANCLAITHLNIIQTNVTAQGVKKFQHIKVVRSDFE